MAASFSLLLLPLVALLALAAGISTGASPIFKQTRVGIGGRPFTIYKLRTLYPHAPKDVHRRHAEHLSTPVGRVMRKLKLDELPQLWNVVKGDMALVGPRPIIPEEYGESLDHLRLTVRPGLTGLWQLSRVREERFDANPEYDLFYLANRSLSFDLWLIWRTVLLLATGRQTKIRLAARLWERNPAWRKLVPERELAIPPRQGLLRSRVWLGGAAAVLGVFCALGVLQVYRAGSDLQSARTALTGLKAAAAELNFEAAGSALASAEESFDGARRRLHSPPARLLAAIPVLRQNRQVAVAVGDAGRELTAAGARGMELLQTLPTEDGTLVPPFRSGRLDGDALAQASAPARQVREAIARARSQLESSPDSLLLPQVRDARRAALTELGELAEQADTVSAITLLLPKVFGFEEPRTWVLGAENNSELRGRGGYLGSIGTLHSEGGAVSLGEFRPVSNLPTLPEEPAGDGADREYLEQYGMLGAGAAWQNLLMSPDFPTGARLFLHQLRQSAGIDAGGLITIDPIGLSYLMEATGPLDVPGVPETLTPQNVVDWSLNRLYVLYPDSDERKELLSDIAAAVWTRLVAAEDLEVRRVGQGLAKAVRGRHLVMYSADPEEQELIESLGIGGTLEPAAGDYLLLLDQNVGENKMDYYVSRSIDYTGRILPDGSLEAEARITVHNGAPDEVPHYIGGAREEIDLGPARSRSFMSLYTPLQARLLQVVRDGEQTESFLNSVEKGKRRFATLVELPAGQSTTIIFRYLIPEVAGDGDYQLTVQNQARVKPDRLAVHIEPPPDAEVLEREGFGLGALEYSAPLEGSLELRARMSEVRGGLLERLLTWLREPVVAGA